ncbi:hypothetical protein [Oricola sp.]|uniref:hypothetical protein n=1 Tax=Oricola sp. TaxID=1979950 RepID=UPI0025FE9389|nr:hypothetical protein [Oricola sp.]MCI5073648.1 hypothetical protein [Oricola sp.]
MQPSNTLETIMIERAGTQIATGEKNFVDLDSVELELAIDPNILRDAGFEDCLKAAARATGFDFLFQLPAFDQVPGQRIAVLSTDSGRDLLYAVLGDSGAEIEIIPEEAMRAEIRDFAESFMDVFLRIGDKQS